MTNYGTQLFTIDFQDGYDKVRLKFVGKFLLLKRKWVPGHMGIKGNEIADHLARNGDYQELGSCGSL